MSEDLDSKKELKTPSEEVGLVSIIIPVYNVEKYLVYALDSVLSQTYKKLDIILVDDGSTDKSLDIALEYAKKDKRIFVVSKLNGGLSTARNLGTELVKNTHLREALESKKKQALDSKTLYKTKELKENLDIKLQSKKEFFCSKPYSLEFYKRKNLAFFTSKNYFVNIIHAFASKPFGDSPIFNGSFSKEELRDFNKLNTIFKRPSLNHFLNLTPKLPSKRLLYSFTYEEGGFFRFHEQDITPLLCQDLPSKQFIHYFDSDDFMQKACVSSCMDALEKDTEVLIHHYSIFWDGVPAWHKLKFPPHFVEQLAMEFGEKSFEGSALFCCLKKCNANFGWHGLISNSYLNKIRLRFTSFLDMEDLNFGMILFAKARFIKVLFKPLIAYRLRKDSISNYLDAKDITVPASLKYLSTHFKKESHIRTYFNIFCHFFAIFDTYLMLYKSSSLKPEALRALKKQMIDILSWRTWPALVYENKGEDALHIATIIDYLDFLKQYEDLDPDVKLAFKFGKKNYFRYKGIITFFYRVVRKIKRVLYYVARFIYRGLGLKALKKRWLAREDKLKN
ncbi:hypothetical protein BKH43_06035 [Helicobacter sp. 13S00401-1]|uniref:glycosyltransferase family 2 protein n=1 Tax=Helicobacter sp. 13S00401-1 TaxID=1905758 RepID=UPI000BDC8522|nr:glycosyltransferase family A protein [Helicobacter sp. 13S00401-1]PAF50050.1 hypothetical protein BKH43_06035 [Helicobacter sp. 13S00401-1]